jgi:large subunit ribosomal protein L4
MAEEHQASGDGLELKPIHPDLNPEVFSCPVRIPLLHDLVQMHLAAKRAGTAATKTKGLVRGGGKKPWKQKGTGRARAGSTRSPLWVGGGTIFGPKPREYAYRVPKSARRTGLKAALSWKRETGKLLVIEDFDLPEIKTKRMAASLKSIGIQDALVVIPEGNERIEKSARNLPRIKVTKAEGLNTYDILRYHTLLLTRRSLEIVEKRLGK